MSPNGSMNTRLDTEGSTRPWSTSPISICQFTTNQSHPRLQKYQHAHTKRWAESVNSADAFAFVTPEYNYGPSPSLVNALNYVYVEWNYKPAGFVSYGGVSGGLRAVQAVKLQATTLKLVTPPEGVPIPNVMQFIDKDKIFRSNELIDASAKTMLDELLKWAGPLKQMRG